MSTLYTYRKLCSMSITHSYSSVIDTNDYNKRWKRVSESNAVLCSKRNVEAKDNYVFNERSNRCNEFIALKCSENL